MPDSSKQSASCRPIPPKSGIGLRADHYSALLAEQPSVGFLEVHSENFLGAGGRPITVLEWARDHYPLSLHGVGLSLGTTDRLNWDHLQKLRSLIGWVGPAYVSEHVCWSSKDGRYFNDLLPLPYTEEALAHVRDRILWVQDYLGRRILIENIASYLEFEHSTLPEWEFISALAKESDCRLLLDVNNVHVSAMNLGFDARRYINSIPPHLVQEIHLAGHSVNHTPWGDILIDSHDCPVAPPVWQIYSLAVGRFGPVPTLIEWDSNLPSLGELVHEAQKADRILEAPGAVAA